MLFNCIHCGKTVSSKHQACVYCKGELSLVIREFAAQHKYQHAKEVKEKYAGTLLSLLLKTKVR